ncbi:MAG: DUF1572 family protein [Bacteroidia bacterium]
MWKEALVELFERDIYRVKEELLAYEDERDMWLLQANITNTAGNLALHLIGNLNHFIGATLGNSGYVRTRELEFSSRNVPRAEIIANLENTAKIVKSSILSLSETNFSQNFPLEKDGKILSMTYMLLHLLTHLDYHLGQINYHRRMLLR